MKIYVLAVLATMSDTRVSFDGSVFRDMFTKNGIDAIAINHTSEGLLYVAYETTVLSKTVLYNHDVFMEYRNRSIK